MTGFLPEQIEAIRASQLFDADWYLGQYPDVRVLSIDPAEHYLWLGFRLGRDPSLRFDADAYLRSNPDVAAAGLNPLLHYIQHGQQEGRALVAVNGTGHRLQTDHSHQPARGGSREPVAPAAQVPPWRGKGAVNAPKWNASPLIKALEQQNLLAAMDMPGEVLEYANSLLSGNRPTVSVIVPTWNRATVICAALDSALAQSFGPLEIIISDDGSTDGTLAVVRNSYGDELRSGRIRIVENAHRGVSNARNAGMKAAKGELFAYLDSDNVWTPHFLLLMAAIFVEQDELMTAYAGLHSLDRQSGREIVRASPFDRKKIINSNTIDLNVFVHRRELYTQFGGFDESLRRLVDWDLILRYTRNYPPAFLPFIGVQYYLDEVALGNITHTQPLDENRGKVLPRLFGERLKCDLEALRLAYFVYDFPALSQSFVISELRWLVANGFDVKVYYAVDPDAMADLDFNIDVIKVHDAEELATRLKRDKRTLCHSHFAYPGVTLFVWPACESAGVPFTFMPHAVDIFHHANRTRNKVAEIAGSPFCLKIFVHGDFHRSFLVKQGVPSHKIAYTLQAVDLSRFVTAPRSAGGPAAKQGLRRGIFIGRLIEKKGVQFLIEAAKALRDVEVEFDIYGYGPIQGELERAVVEAKLHNVHFRGVLHDRDQIAAAYEQADFLLVPSVEAENGDLDGFPTVVLEAMAANVPVIATTVAAIPDYLRDGIEAILVPPRDAVELARAIRELLEMPADRRLALTERARTFLARSAGVERTMGRLLDTWYGYSIDVILVTHNTQKSDNRAETFEIVRRVLDHTTTEFTLTIVDNASDEDFWRELVEAVAGRLNVRLIRKRTNLLCGPATNLALAAGHSAYAVYLCSKEAFVKEHGWERPLIDYMRAHPAVAIAGHKTHLPKYTYGSELVQHPEFDKFRNPGFAASNPEMPFKHVQGGIFIARRDALLSVGGFNDQTPHHHMDVELSYFLESIGYETGEIACVASVTKKTLPKLSSILDERTVAAHPLALPDAAQLDRLKGSARHCNICGWTGSAYAAAHSGNACPDCGSTPFGRMVFRALANDHRAFRGASCAVLSSDTGLIQVLGGRMFRLAVHTTKPVEFANAVQTVSPSPACIILDDSLVGDAEWPDLWACIEQTIGPDGEVLVSGSGWDGAAPGIAQQSAHWTADWIDLSSQTVGYDWRRLMRLIRRHGSDVDASNGVAAMFQYDYA